MVDAVHREIDVVQSEGYAVQCAKRGSRGDGSFELPGP